MYRYDKVRLTQLCLLILVALNFFDALATHYVLDHGLAVEYNPLVSYIYEYSPIVFGFSKAALAFSFAIFLWDECHLPDVQKNVMIATIGYLLLFIYELLLLFSLK